MMTRTTSLLSAVALSATLLSVGAPDVSAEERRIATLAPRGSAWMKELERGANAISKYTQGRVTVKYFPGGVQGNERDVVRKIRGGGLEGGALTTVGLSLIDKSIRVLELPLLYKNLDEMDYVRRKMWPYFKRKFARKGYILGNGGDVGWIYIVSKKKVTTRADLGRVKMFMSVDDPVSKTIFRKMGLRGVPMSIPDVLPSLKAGKIDTAFASPLAAEALQWTSNLRYMTDMPIAYAMGSSLVKKDVWDRASKADRNVIRQVSKQVSAKIRRKVRRSNKDSRRAMQRKGITIVQPDPALRAEFEKAALATYKSLVGSVYSQKELDMVLKYRAEYRAKNP